jgi:ClpP class serine protease
MSFAGLWLLSPVALARMAELRRAGGAELAARAAAWEAEARAGEVTADVNGPQLPRGMTIAGSTAEIRVDGVLTKRPDFWAWLLGEGNTTYGSIRTALAVAATEPGIKTIVLAIDSPGGSVDGLFETLDAIASLRASGGKTIKVRAENATSAAYGIAAAAGPIEATSRASTFGSIGTAVSYLIDPQVVTLTNSDSPDKRPDLTTDGGKAVVVKYLDQVNDELVRAIARGREVDAKTVIETFGRGAVLTAPHAQKLGMIDKITTTPLRAVTSKGKSMVIKDEDSDNGAAALQAATERGVARERDRVLAHVTLGESSGAMNVALEAIRSGAEMTQEFTARYLAAGMNRADASRRQAESNGAEGAVAATAGSSSASGDIGDQAVALIKGSTRSFIRA